MKTHKFKLIETARILVHMTEQDSTDSGMGQSYLTLPARGRSSERDSVIATLNARMQLMADLTTPELFVHVAEGSTPDQTLAQLTSTTGAAFGWEGTIFPTNTQRRRLALPRGARLTRGLTEASLEQLPDLDPRVLAAFEDPHIEPADSFVLHVNDQVLGCIPVIRLSPTTVTFRAVIHDKALHADDPRRRSFLRLAAWSTASDIHLGEGSTILSWIPDDGDPINEYKLQVGAPDWVTHWVTYRVLPHHLNESK
jgi:hypothetical protein